MSDHHYHVYVYLGDDLDPAENHVVRTATGAEGKARRLRHPGQQARVVRCSQRLADCEGLPSRVPAPVQPTREPRDSFEHWKADNGW